MSTLKVYDSATLIRAGQIDAQIDTPYQPYYEVTLVSGNIVHKRVTVAAASRQTLYEYGASGEVVTSFVGCRIKTTAAAWLAWKGDKATSSSDLTPLGTHICWNAKGICPQFPEYLEDAVPVNDAPVDHVTDPGPLAHANQETGRIYEIEVENPDADDALTVDIWFFI